MVVKIPWTQITRLVGRVVREQLRSSQRRHPSSFQPRAGNDFEGCPAMEYGRRGPGGLESGDVVWTWVAYEEDASQGKDRPVLLIGSDQGWLLGLPATSQDHDRDAEQERRAGRFWVDIGTGDWDSKGRPSEVRVDRIVRVDPAKVRRADGHVSRAIFDEVAEGVRQHWDD